jgi:hypothetical protein
MTYYVYELVVIPDGNVCYVGKGKNKRMYDHKRNMHASCHASTGLYRRLRELVASGKDFVPRKVFETYSETLALWEEGRRIQLYGFDNLFNSTTITGPREKDLTEVRSQALSKASCEARERNRRLYGKGLPPETCEKIKALHAAGTWANHYPNFYKAGQAATKGRTMSEVEKQHLRQVNLKYTEDELLEDARQYPSITRWEQDSPAKEHAAYRLGPDFFDRCTAHMSKKLYGRSRANLSLAEEDVFLSQFQGKTKIADVQAVFQHQFNRPISIGGAYDMMRRHEVSRSCHWREDALGRSPESDHS